MATHEDFIAIDKTTKEIYRIISRDSNKNLATLAGLSDINSNTFEKSLDEIDLHSFSNLYDQRGRLILDLDIVRGEFNGDKLFGLVNSYYKKSSFHSIFDELIWEINILEFKSGTFNISRKITLDKKLVSDYKLRVYGPLSSIGTLLNDE